MDFLYTHIDNIKGIGKKRVELYNKLGIFSIYDILQYYPIKYIDFSNTVSISSLQVGETVSIKCTLILKKELFVRKNLTIYKLYVKDKNNDTLTINIFNNRYLYNSFIVDKEYIFNGKIYGDLLNKFMNNPKYIEYGKKDIYIEPIYRSIGALTSKIIELNIKTILNILKEMSFNNKDFLNDEILKKFDLVNFYDAFLNIHFPKNKDMIDKSRKRLIFDEVFNLQLALKVLKNKNLKKVNEFKLLNTKKLFEEFKKYLKFSLTFDQENVINECLSDLNSGLCMNRLIQGDVGSGKTVVCMAVSYILSKNGFQSCIMVPTEVLAKQHFKNFVNTIGEFVNIEVLTSSNTKKEKQTIYNRVKEGEIDILIGTHSLLNEALIFKNLALIVTDEQHRFGVKQRVNLVKKSKYEHSMIMSATPIPRTLSLIIYGDLDISYIKTKPIGRQKIDTFAITERKKERAFNFINDLINKGQQGYFVCPLIENNDNDEENEEKLKNVIDYSVELKNKWFKNCNIGVIHGKMKASEKNKVLEDFNNKKYDIIVSTTVIEVGIDVKNATFMVIENAERFGLSTLHQLRGRVGRGDLKSYCILINNSFSDNTIKRLRALCENDDGFILSKIDLDLRGPGEFFGSKQHGLPELKIANLSKDLDFIQKISVFSSEYISEDDNFCLDKNKYIKKNIENMFIKNNNIFN